MSKKTQAAADTMFREAVAKQIQTMGARPDGVTMVVESGTASFSRETLQDVVNRLHAERDPLVVKARVVRMEKGVASPEFAAAWFDVERITRDLEDVEQALAKAGEAEKAWRDATVDKPDDEIAVMLRLASEGDEPLALGHHADETWWINGADPVALGLDVIGWMHVHEAAAILDHATRSNARGEVANG